MHGCCINVGGVRGRGLRWTQDGEALLPEDGEKKQQGAKRSKKVFRDAEVQGQARHMMQYEQPRFVALSDRTGALGRDRHRAEVEWLGSLQLVVRLQQLRALGGELHGVWR